MKPIFNTTRGIYRTRDRLAYYRQQAQQSAEKYPERSALIGSNGWRYWKRRIWQTPNTARASEGIAGRHGAILSDSLEQYGENIGDADKLTRLDHRGWFTDDYYDETILGAVVKCRCSRGTLYIPATYCTGWDGTIHYIGDAELVPKGADESQHEQAQRYAARRADYFAEREADESRESYARDRAEQDISEARERIHELNREALELIREAKAQRSLFGPAVCQAIRGQVVAMLAERAEQFRTIAARRADFWTACP